MVTSYPWRVHLLSRAISNSKLGFRIGSKFSIMNRPIHRFGPSDWSDVSHSVVQSIRQAECFPPCDSSSWAEFNLLRRNQSSFVQRPNNGLRARIKKNVDCGVRKRLPSIMYELDCKQWRSKLPETTYRKVATTESGRCIFAPPFIAPTARPSQRLACSPIWFLSSAEDKIQPCHVVCFKSERSTSPSTRSNVTTEANDRWRALVQP